MMHLAMSFFSSNAFTHMNWASFASAAHAVMHRFVGGMFF